jgi:S1-C subfamily serine protease
VLVVALLSAVLGSAVGTAGTFALLGGNDDPVPVAEPVVRVDDDEERVAPRLEIQASDGLDRVAAVAETVLPTVVMVEVNGGGPAGAPGLSGNGSGVVYRSDGHIITNHHVISGADDVRIVFSDGSRADAEIVGSSPDNDLAVLKVEDTGDLTAIQIGDSSQVRVGELAVAVGSPFGLEGSVTAGVVSSLNRLIPVTGPGGQQFSLPNVIQTDAPINPGNSGGPLVAGDATLIGINSAILTQGGGGTNAGVGFAIPANVAVEVADQLIDQGFVRQAFLGVAGMNVNREIAERVGVDEGAIIEEVVAGTPAADAGLRPGDVIVAVDDQAIAAMDDLITEIFNLDVGDVVGITYIRDGQEETVEVTLAEKPSQTTE